jgi:hypothetical protein
MTTNNETMADALELLLLNQHALPALRKWPCGSRHVAPLTHAQTSSPHWSDLM